MRSMHTGGARDAQCACMRCNRCQICMQEGWQGSSRCAADMQELQQMPNVHAEGAAGLQQMRVCMRETQQMRVSCLHDGRMCALSGVGAQQIRIL